MHIVLSGMNIALLLMNVLDYLVSSIPDFQVVVSLKYHFWLKTLIYANTKYKHSKIIGHCNQLYHRFLAFDRSMKMFTCVVALTPPLTLDSGIIIHKKNSKRKLKRVCLNIHVFEFYSKFIYVILLIWYYK